MHLRSRHYYGSISTSAVLAKMTASQGTGPSTLSMPRFRCIPRRLQDTQPVRHSRVDHLQEIRAVRKGCADFRAQRLLHDGPLGRLLCMFEIEFLQPNVQAVAFTFG